jgi:sortase A
MSKETYKKEEINTGEGAPADLIQEKNEERDGKKKPEKKKGGSLSTVILVIIMLIGLAVFLYPSVSDWWNSMHASRAIAGYVDAVDELSEAEKDAMLEAARMYNDSLSEGVHFNLSDEEYAEYESILDVTGTGIMGYIQIPSIGVNLPVYHGVDEGILQIAAGHIPGSSFPVGGDGVHSVMSGHRGLPSAKLFSDLDKLDEGDVFTVTVLDETITYMVDQIRIVLPEETDELGIVNGKDYSTLVTCTPYGINSHRILMRGHRIAGLDGIAAPAEAVRIPVYIVIPAIGIPILFLLLTGLLIYYRRRGPMKSEEQILDDMRKG